MSDESEQNARAELKKRYFDFTSHLEDKDATVQLYQKNTVFVVKCLAIQGNSDHFIVENLKTPTGVLEKAVLRSSDIMFLTTPFTPDEASV